MAAKKGKPKKKYKSHKPYIHDKYLAQLVLECVIQKFNNDESRAYLKPYHYEDIGNRTLARIRSALKKGEPEVLANIAKEGFVSQHLERIAQLEFIIKQLWANYHAETDPYKRSQIALAVAQVQPYLSQYYAASKKVMEDNATYIKDRQQSADIPAGSTTPANS